MSGSILTEPQPKHKWMVEEYSLLTLTLTLMYGDFWWTSSTLFDMLMKNGRILRVIILIKKL